MNKHSQKASLKISQDVIETISRVATLEVEGVAEVIPPQNTLFGKWNTNGVDIKINDGVAEISLSISLNYGAKIAETCSAVQKSVKENVQTMTGIMVSRVNIAVEGITLPQPTATNAEVVTIPIED